MGGVLELEPQEFAQRLGGAGGRGWLVWDPASGRPRASSADLDEVALALAEGALDYDRHEAIFLEVGRRSGALFGAFLHRSRRGQAQGGLRLWPYPSAGGFLRDGLRLSRAMGRKCALAGLWWGGGKGLIARPPGDRWRDPEWRQTLYAEFGRFVSSLRGAYVTAEDVGTTPADMAEVSRNTRFATCIPSEVGGSGNPSSMTALGVVCAMEAAQAFCGRDLAGAAVAMQGAGNVGTFMIEHLLERRVARIRVSEISPERVEALRARFDPDRVSVVQAEPGDSSILAAACDVLSPNALGGALSPETIPTIRARVVCGAANNQLVDDRRDDRLLAARGITYVPDFIANRMGIVNCSNEQYGSLPDDPAVSRHLDPEWEWSIHRVTRRVLESARDEGRTPVATANALADRASEEPHPIFPERTARIIESLVAGGWAVGPPSGDVG